VIQYVIAGLVLGGIYAISAAGLVVTYRAAGILNFAFGAMSFFVARAYYFLHVQHHLGIAPAALVAVVAIGPGLGLVLYGALFRYLQTASTLVRIVTTLGLAVVLPSLATLVFGDVQIFQAPGLAPEPVRVFHVDGVPITMDQIIVYACVVAVVVVGAVVLGLTDVGLRVRAMVDSPAMTSLSGVNPRLVAGGVWMASSFLAGLAGVLSAPVIGLSSSVFTLLMASAFAAVIAARLRSLPVAIVVALAMGVADSLVQHYLPPSSSLAQAAIPTIPFAVMAVFLLAYIVRGHRVEELTGRGGALDRAIAVQAPARAASAVLGRRADRLAPVALVAVVALLPLVLSGLWVGLVAAGIAYGVLFLAYTLLVGEGGMVWLCVPTFAGIGALATGQLAGLHHWPVLAAMVAGGLLAALVGGAIGLLTVRLGDLYVALVTLSFGLLMENLVFSRQTFLRHGLGVSLSAPSFASSTRGLAYLGLAVFVVLGLFVVNVRRSTPGMALAAIRSSDPAARTTGVDVVRLKVVVAAIAAFVAAVGGALFALNQGVALPSDYDTLLGVTWLATVVLCGIRSSVAALIAGLLTTVFPGIAQNYLPTWFAQVPPIMFGLGAIGIARNPDGVLAHQVRSLLGLVARAAGRRPAAVAAQPAEDVAGRGSQVGAGSAASAQVGR